VPDRAQVALAGDARTVVVERPVAQTTLALAGPTRLDPRDPDTGLLAALANQVLSSGPQSRLFRSVREELGASYGSQSTLVPVGGVAQVFLITSAVDHGLAGKALATLREQYDLFRRDGVAAAELAPVRARAVTALEEGLGRSEIAARLRGALTAGRDPGEASTAPARAAAATSEAVSALVAERFPAGPLAAVIVAPSAEGFAADCVVRRDQPIEACLPR
jgi:predicted Zn-dependent peptidase